MIAYCEVLDAPFLVIETPARYTLDQEEVDRARDFFSSINFRDIRLVWELRAPISSAVINLMQNFNIVHCVDLSMGKPSFHSNVVYSRLFGKGRHNIYQFTDEELVEIDRNSQSSHKVIALSYHGVRMHTDAIRFMQYKKTDRFMPATGFTGVNSVRAVLHEDAEFPSSKYKLIEEQGWKVVDLSVEKRVHLSELLSDIPDKTYKSIGEVTEELKIK